LAAPVTAIWPRPGRRAAILNCAQRCTSSLPLRGREQRVGVVAPGVRRLKRAQARLLPPPRRLRRHPSYDLPGSPTTPSLRDTPPRAGGEAAGGERPGAHPRAGGECPGLTLNQGGEFKTFPSLLRRGAREAGGVVTKDLPSLLLESICLAGERRLPRRAHGRTLFH